MKSVLIVSDVNLFPTIAGNRRRIKNLIDNMRDLGFKVYYLYIRSSTENVAQLKEYIGKQQLFTYNSGKKSFGSELRSYCRNVIAKFGLEEKLIIKYKVDDLCPVGIEEYVCKLVEKHQIDTVMCEYIKLSKALTNLPSKVNKVIDTHDIIADRHKLFLELGQGLPFFYVSKNEEKKAVNRADKVIAIQKLEEKYFRKMLAPGKTAITIGDSVSVTDPYVTHNKKITFIGSAYAMNVVAIREFIENILPLIHEMDPEIELQVVGKVCAEIPDSTKYTKLGIVDSIDDVYRDSRIIVNPILGGTGLNIKTVEAMSYAKPLVVTPVGARGISKSCKGLAVAKNNESFAKEVVRIVNDDDIILEMSKGAVQYIEGYNRANQQNLLKVLENV